MPLVAAQVPREARRRNCWSAPKGRRSKYFGEKTAYTLWIHPKLPLRCYIFRHVMSTVVADAKCALSRSITPLIDHAARGERFCGRECTTSGPKLQWVTAGKLPRRSRPTKTIGEIPRSPQESHATSVRVGSTYAALCKNPSDFIFLPRPSRILPQLGQTNQTRVTTTEYLVRSGRPNLAEPCLTFSVWSPRAGQHCFCLEPFGQPDTTKHPRAPFDERGTERAMAGADSPCCWANL